ncbi:MAG TPA: Uma2 family endonuclease [Isosphaeraceae bacterium]|nr:Uma2 family endonuclease [Isosphaeraceae bacterium]
MSTVAPPPPTSSSAVPPGPPPLYRMTVDEYDRIGGLLDDPRIELLDGYLVRKLPKNPEHSWTTKAVFKGRDNRLPPGWTWQTEQPVRIPAYDEPEPDIAIIRGSDADYKHRKPGPADVALLVEVSDTTLSIDRGLKLSAYAREGIPVYWIVNLVDRQVEVHTGPGPAGYAMRQDFQPGQHVPVVIGGQQCAPIAVDSILP